MLFRSQVVTHYEKNIRSNGHQKGQRKEHETRELEQGRSLSFLTLPALSLSLDRLPFTSLTPCFSNVSDHLTFFVPGEPGTQNEGTSHTHSSNTWR